MGWWQVGTDTLAGSRFVVSPLAEATSCLMALAKGAPALPGEQQWFDAHLPAYRERLAADPITAELVRAGFRKGWTANFLVPTPVGDETFAEEVRRVREAASPVADLVETAEKTTGRMPALLQRDGLGSRAAELLEWVWDRVVLPDWDRRRRILEADVVARTRQLSTGGWTEALSSLRPQMRWLGGGRLRINNYEYPPLEVAGKLLFVPVTPRHGWVTWTQPHRYAVVYPCSGVLAEQRAVVPDALGRLLGVHRARILVLLATPLSTSQLVLLTGQGLGSVGRHLRVLLDAGLVVRRRSGRVVLYCRGDVGDALVRAGA